MARSPHFSSAFSTFVAVYVLKADTHLASFGAGTVLLEAFQIDPMGLQLVALDSQQPLLDGALVSVAVTQHGFYLFVNQNTNFSTAELEGIFFDPVTGQPPTAQQLLNVGITPQRMLVDTLGKNLLLSAGQACSNLWFASLSPTDGGGTQTAPRPCLAD